MGRKFIELNAISKHGFWFKVPSQPATVLAAVASLRFYSLILSFSQD